MPETFLVGSAPGVELHGVAFWAAIQAELQTGVSCIHLIHQVSLLCPHVCDIGPFISGTATCENRLITEKVEFICLIHHVHSKLQRLLYQIKIPVCIQLNEPKMKP